MVWLKSCPRCERGDLMLEAERDGWSVNCLQCGYTKDVEDPILAGLSSVANQAAAVPSSGVALSSTGEGG